LDHETASQLGGDSKRKLLVVADGMGGHASGERASTIAVDCLANYLLETVKWFCRPGDRSDDDFLGELKSALLQCQSRILAEAAIEPECRGMGTTVTMAYIAWPKLYLAHVGDSRCYWMRQSRLKQITRDHTIAQQFVDEGTMSPESAKTSWLGNALWNVVGGPSSALQPEVYKARLRAGDTLMLCSDGLNKHLSDGLIASVLSDGSDAQGACRRLVDMTNKAGGSDNVTVIVAKFLRDENDPEDYESGSVLDHPIEKASYEMDTLPLEKSVTISGTRKSRS
jgi:protein phosphatase